MLRTTSRISRKHSMYIKNLFYNGHQSPSAIIALNSPALGDYERRLLCTIFEQSDTQQKKASTTERPHSAKRVKPLFLCADGAYSKIAQQASLLSAVDMVVGDGDSLLWWKQQEASLEASSQATTNNGAPLPSPVSHIVLHHAEHFGCHDRHGSVAATASVGLPSEGDAVEHFQLLEQAFQRRKALFVRVLDQNTSDFEKCLTVCERVLASPHWKTATSNSEEVDRSGSGVQGDGNRNEIKRYVVLVIGFQGGEWHHEMAALHAGAKYSASNLSRRSSSSPPSILDLRFHAPNTTIAFCNPNGTTIFDRNLAFENKTFALIPFGESPVSMVTTGLQWNLDHHRRTAPSDCAEVPYFGFTNASVRSSYISTSNRITDPDGRVTIEAVGSDACVVALAIHLDAESALHPPPPPPAAAAQCEQKLAPRLGVTMLVFRDVDASKETGDHATKATEYLLVQRGKAPSKGLWGCPGGSVEWGEPTLDAAVRELKEETGLTVDGASLSMPLGGRPVLTSDVIVKKREQDVLNEPVASKQHQHHFVLMHFAAQLHSHEQDASLRAGDDATAVAWKSKSEIAEMVKEGRCVAGVLDVVGAVETAMKAQQGSLAASKL
jgi:ADP-ribose pyrophosphatase YjhB (NUDIX family)/thiamine pyrophosphokinase